MKFVSCLTADENIICREQLRTASGTATLRSHEWDAAVGANRPEFCSAPSTDSLRNFCSRQLNLSSSASSFCRVAPGDICPLFITHIEIYNWKTTEIRSISNQSSNFFEGLYKESSRKMCLWKQTGCVLQELSLGSVTGLCLECMFTNNLDQEWFCELGHKLQSVWKVK